MKDIDSMSAAVREVIDNYPAGHEFYGNQLKDDVVRIYPEAQYMYPDTILRMARRHRRASFCVVDQNNSLYKKTVVIPITEQIKQVIPEPEPVVTRHEYAEPAQGFLFAFMLLIAVFTAGFSRNAGNSAKFAVSLTMWKAENATFLQISETFFENPLSIPVIRHDIYSMPGMANINRLPEVPATKWHARAAKGELYEESRTKNQGINS